jgi:hypothetical protein
MRKVLAVLLVATAAALTATGSKAHHGWSSYDESKPLTVRGAVLSVKWENPHGEITINYQGAVWEVALAPTGRMENRGLQQSALTVGKIVEVVAYAMKTGEKEMRAERITVDGKTVELR